MFDDEVKSWFNQKSNWYVDEKGSIFIRVLLFRLREDKMKTETAAHAAVSCLLSLQFPACVNSVMDPQLI